MFSHSESAGAFMHVISLHTSHWVGIRSCASSSMHVLSGVTLIVAVNINPLHAVVLEKQRDRFACSDTFHTTFFSRYHAFLCIYLTRYFDTFLYNYLFYVKYLTIKVFIHCIILTTKIILHIYRFGSRLIQVGRGSITHNQYNHNQWWRIWKHCITGIRT